MARQLRRLKRDDRQAHLQGLFLVSLFYHHFVIFHLYVAICMFSSSIHYFHLNFFFLRLALFICIFIFINLAVTSFFWMTLDTVYVTVLVKVRVLLAHYFILNYFSFGFSRPPHHIAFIFLVLVVSHSLMHLSHTISNSRLVSNSPVSLCLAVGGSLLF